MVIEQQYHFGKMNLIIYNGMVIHLCLDVPELTVEMAERNSLELFSLFHIGWPDIIQLYNYINTTRHNCLINLVVTSLYENI